MHSGKLNDRFWDVICDDDDNIIATGVAFDGDGEALFSTLKLDSEGGVIWLREESGAVQNTTRAGWLDLDATGNVVMVNRSWVSGEAYNVILRKYAAGDGHTLWESEYNSPTNGTDDPRSMCLDSADDVIVTGVSNSDYMTLKFDGTDGSLIWLVGYDGPPGWYDLANYVMEGSGGEILVTGFSDGGETGWDVLIQAIDNELGKSLWTLRHNGSDDLTDEGCAVALSPLGDLYLVGYSYFFATDQDHLVIRYLPDSTDLPDVIAGVGRLSAWPNPFAATTTLRLTMEREQIVELGIYDVTGRLVRKLGAGQRESGDYEMIWDGRDSGGRNLPAGVYFARSVSGASNSLGSKLIKVE